MSNDNHNSKIAKIAQRLYTESGSYYRAAQELGNPNLRASLHRLLNEEAFNPSEDFIKLLLEWAQIQPVVIEVPPGSTIFGAGPGLFNTGQVVAILVKPPAEWRRHSMACAECGATCPRWSPSQEFCHEHSWQTPEGRKYWRQERRQNEPT